MRVLVTRPEPGATRTATLLKARGHRPWIMPLTRTVALAADHDVLGDTPACAYIVTSASALRHWPTPHPEPSSLAVPLYAVGEATAQSARTLGFEDVRTGPGDADALARTLLRDVETGRLIAADAMPVVYAAGRVRRPHVETRLRHRNIPLRTVELYDIEEISYSTDYILERVSTHGQLAILLYSHHAAEVLMRQFDRLQPGKLLENRYFLCLSSHVAEAIPDAFRDRIRIAAAPNEAALLSQLDRLAGRV